MTRAAIAVLFLAATLTVSATAGEKKAAPKLTQEAKDGAQLTQENIVKMKIKTVRPGQPNPQPPSFGGPSLPPPSPPGS
jgi:hypothetical protein